MNHSENDKSFPAQVAGVAAVLKEQGQAPAERDGGGRVATRDEEGAPLQVDDDMIAAIAAAITGENAAKGERAEDGAGRESEPGQTAPEGAEEAPAVSTLAELAQKLGVEARDLYAVKIGLPGGEEATLSELKDQAIMHRKGEAERLAWDERREQERAELVRQRDELRQLVDLVPREALNQQNVNTARAAIERYQQAEAQKLLERVPEWRDRARYTADRADMDRHLQGFGFDPKELDSVYDHRLLAYIRHNALRERRLSAALEAAKDRIKKGQGAATNGARRPQPNNRQARRAGMAQAREVAAILRGQGK